MNEYLEKLSENEENLRYPNDVLAYLAEKLDEHDIHCLELVSLNTSSPFGFQVTKQPDFKEKRRQYDLGLLRLEAQGFIRQLRIGTMRPYYLTVRGEQLNEHLKQQNMDRNN